MKKLSLTMFLLLAIFALPFYAEARGRIGSTRIDGYTSHGKGSHFIGGYVRTGYIPKYYSTH